MRVGVLLLATTVRAIDPIRAHVITLDVYAPRYGDFLERNPHIVNDLQTWKGVDGRKMGYKKLIADGQVDPRGKHDAPPKGPTFTPGMNSEMRMGGGGGGGGGGIRTTKSAVDPRGGAASTAPSSSGFV